MKCLAFTLRVQYASCNVKQFDKDITWVMSLTCNHKKIVIKCFSLFAMVILVTWCLDILKLEIYSEITFAMFLLLEWLTMSSRKV